MLYLTEGDYINAGLSALSIIPGADAFTKTGKASKVLGNGIVESGLKHLDNVADGIKKLVKKADDAIDLEKHLPKKLLTEEAETFAKKADKVADDVVEDAAKAIKGGNSSREIMLSTEKTHESARNTLISELQETGAFKNGSNSYVGRLESSYGYGKQIGRQSLDGKVRWRLDFDEKIGVHYNIENFMNGKGANAIKKVIPIDISYDEYIKILNSWN